jgi:hypothetical protein
MSTLEERIMNEYPNLGVIGALDDVSRERVYIFFDDTLSRNTFMLNVSRANKSHFFNKVEFEGQYILKVNREVLVKLLNERVELRKFIKERFS